MIVIDYRLGIQEDLQAAPEQLPRRTASTESSPRKCPVNCSCGSDLVREHLILFYFIIDLYSIIFCAVSTELSMSTNEDYFFLFLNYKNF